MSDDVTARDGLKSIFELHWHQLYLARPYEERSRTCLYKLNDFGACTIWFPEGRQPRFCIWSPIRKTNTQLTEWLPLPEDEARRESIWLVFIDITAILEMSSSRLMISELAEQVEITGFLEELSELTDEREMSPRPPIHGPSLKH